MPSHVIVKSQSVAHGTIAYVTGERTTIAVVHSKVLRKRMQSQSGNIANVTDFVVLDTEIVFPDCLNIAIRADCVDLSTLTRLGCQRFRRHHRNSCIINWNDHGGSRFHFGGMVVLHEMGFRQGGRKYVWVERCLMLLDIFRRCCCILDSFLFIFYGTTIVQFGVAFT